MPPHPKLVPAAPLIVPEAAAHGDAIERVLDRAFGPGRFAKPSERVREFARALPALSRVALEGGALLGVCRIHEIAIGANPVLFLGPLAVDPDAQHGGLGHLLVSETVAACRVAEAAAIILMGQPSFFETLGFTQVPPDRVTMPIPAEPRRLHWIGLADGVLDNLSGPISPPRAASRS